MAEHHEGDSNEAKIGSPLRRKETERFIQGTGTYADDYSFPNQAYASYVRSFEPHAKILGIDIEAAKAMSGVLGVFTAADWQGVLGAKSRWPLVTDEVHAVGDPIAVVVAETRYQAQDGSNAVVVQYEPLPAVVDPEKGLLPDSPRTFTDLPSNVVYEIHFKSEGRDPDEVFAEADHVVKARIQTQRVLTSPIEPKAAVASFDHVTGEATIWTCSAGVYMPRTQAAQALGIPETKVRVLAADVGGAFGSKGGNVGEHAILPVLARYLRRPVKWTEMRTENLSTANAGRDQLHYLEMAVRKDGKILGMRDRFIANVGAARQFDVSVTSAFLYLTGAYDIQTYKMDSYAVATNTTAHGAVRGIGKADAGYTIERMINIVAREIGMDPAELRMVNLVPEDKFPYRTATGALLDSGRYHLALRTAMDTAGYEQLRKEQAELNSRRPNIRRGVGVSFVIEPTGAARRNAGGGYGACRLKMELSGIVSAYPAGGVQGQGHGTSVSQIVADRLGCSADNVHVVHGDSLLTPYGAGPASSRTSQTVMPAVLIAGNMLRDKILRIAGHRLGVDPSTLRLEGDMIRGNERQITLREIIQIAYQDVDRLPPGEDPALDVMGYFINQNHVYDFDELGRRNEFSTYPYDAAIAVVDVDMETGATEIVKYVSVHDCGTQINPRIVATQHMGATVQGIGAAMFEEVRYDEDGKLLTSTFMDYLLPTASDLPPFVFGHIVTPTPFTPLGAKGAGETGTISAPAVLGNAIEDAIGVPLRKPPFSAENVLKAIREGQNVAAGTPS